jgi:hypothetical protein
MEVGSERSPVKVDELLMQRVRLMNGAAKRLGLPAEKADR